MYFVHFLLLVAFVIGCLTGYNYRDPQPVILLEKEKTQVKPKKVVKKKKKEPHE